MAGPPPSFKINGKYCFSRNLLCPELERRAQERPPRWAPGDPASPPFDYSDSRESRVWNYVPGYSVLTEKAKLAEEFVDLQGEHLPVTFVIRQGAWCRPPNAQIEDADGAGGLFYLKDSVFDAGKGISLHASLAECLAAASPGRTYCVQPEVRNLLLVRGHKCCVRVFVVIVTEEGTEGCEHVLLYPTGYVKLCAQRYERGSMDIGVHLTNACVQSRANRAIFDPEQHQFVFAADSCDFYDQVYPQLQALARLVFQRVRPTLNRSRDAPRKAAFHLLAFDVLVDEALKPWLIEVNSDPSMVRSSSASSVWSRVYEPLVLSLLDAVIEPMVRQGSAAEAAEGLEARGWELL